MYPKTVRMGAIVPPFSNKNNPGVRERERERERRREIANEREKKRD